MLATVQVLWYRVNPALVELICKLGVHSFRGSNNAESQKEGSSPLLPGEPLGPVEMCSLFLPTSFTDSDKLGRKSITNHKTGAIITFPRAWSAYLSYIYMSKRGYWSNSLLDRKVCLKVTVSVCTENWQVVSLLKL